MAKHIAYFRSDAAVDATIYASQDFTAAPRVGSLWSADITMHADVAWSPVLLVVQFVIATLLTIVICGVALCAVRLIVCRGIAGLRTNLDLQGNERTMLGWGVVGFSPVFSFLGAVGFGMGITLAARYSRLTMPSSALAFPPEHVGWAVPVAFATACAAAWGLWTVGRVRARQAAAHRAKEYCARCGYVYGGIIAEPCPECGGIAPTGRTGSCRRAVVLWVLVLPLVAMCSGVATTESVPGLISYAFDPNITMANSGFAVSVPLRRPILVEGDWGRAYFVAAPVDTGETLVRGVLMNADDQPARVATTLIGGATPAGGLRAWLDIAPMPSLLDEGLIASVYNLSLGDPESRFVVVDQLATAPRRIRALPKGADLPMEVREVLDGAFPDNASTARLVEGES